MPQFTVKFDDQNKSLVKALEKRTRLLEKMLTQKKQTQVISIKSDSPMVQSLNSRIKLLERLLKNNKSTSNDRQIISMQRSVDKLLTAFGTRNFTRGISVIPSPS